MIRLLACLLLFAAASPAFSQGGALPDNEVLPHSEANLSLRNEVQIAIDKGLAWLQKNQNPDGSWSLPDYPALTALPLWAFMGDPAGKMQSGEKPPFIRKGYDFILGSVQPDGGIYRKGLANYNTAISLVALVLAGNPKYDATIRASHDFEVGQQAHGLADPSLDGGIGYGPTGAARAHPDLSNTVIALEAIRRSEAIAAREHPGGPKLDWQAAIQFVQRCQNLPQVNKASYVSAAPDDRGGFIYFPGESAAGETGAKGARSYGSMSYAGLLSYIYADLSKSDPRVTSAVDWLKAHYSLDENPGMGADGLFYYYQVMAKGLAAHGGGDLKLADGRTVNWPRDLALKLIDLQEENGSWKNESGRWMEKDPVVATSYAVLTLEIVCRAL